VSSALRMKTNLFVPQYPQSSYLLFNKRCLYNSVSRGSQLLQQEFFCVFEHIVMLRMRIINRKKNKPKLNLWVCLNQLPSSVVSTTGLPELMALNDLIKH